MPHLKILAARRPALLSLVALLCVAACSESTSRIQQFAPSGRNEAAQVLYRTNLVHTGRAILSVVVDEQRAGRAHEAGWLPSVATLPGERVLD